MNAQTYFIHPRFQAQRTSTPTVPLTFRLDTHAKTIAEKIRRELLRLRLGATV